MPHSLSNTNNNRVGGTSAMSQETAVTAVTSVRCSDRLRSVADSGVARCALSIRPLLGCAGHFLPSDLRRPARSCDQVRRVVDPSSQPHAPRRIRCTRWPDEGSALEMADSDDDRSHSKGHDRWSRCSRSLQRPCDRLAARLAQLAALVTGHAPCPVCCAHGTSVAQLEGPRDVWTV
jgi:hypothetical protein